MFYVSLVHFNGMQDSIVPFILDYSFIFQEHKLWEILKFCPQMVPVLVCKSYSSSNSDPCCYFRQFNQL